MKLYKRHKIATALIKPLLKAFLRLRYNAVSFPFEPSGGATPPCIILSNHNSDLDPFFVSFCFDFPVYFVASDHIFRWGLISRIIKYLVSPIPKLKSTSDAQTVRDIMSVMRAGGSVCVFPEGNRSWNGETQPFSPAIGKLVARLNVPLILCRIDGAYLSSPRWADHMRRGRIECRVVGQYPPEALSSFSADGLNDLIRAHLYADATKTQKNWKAAYRGKNLAQSIETVLYACPRCGRFATIRSEGDRAFCGCGLIFRFSPLGFLEDAPFETILQWDLWQKSHIRSKIGEFLRHKTSDPIWSDGDQCLVSVVRAASARLVDRGELLMFCNRFVFKGIVTTRDFYFKDISRLSIHGRLVLQFSLSDGSPFEITSRRVRSAYKYAEAYELLKAAAAEGCKI